MVPPDTADLVEKRLFRMRIRHDDRQRKIRGDKGPGQHPETCRHQHQLDQRRRPGQRHQPRVVHLRAPERQRGLHQRHHQREYQREMPKLCLLYTSRRG